LEHARELAARLLLAPLIARATPSIADGLHDLGVLAGDRRGGKRELEGAVRVSHRRRTLAGWTVWGVSLWSNGRNARTGGGLRNEITNTEPDQINTALAFPLKVTPRGVPGESPDTPRAGKDTLAVLNILQDRSLNIPPPKPFGVQIFHLPYMAVHQITFYQIFQLAIYSPTI